MHPMHSTGTSQLSNTSTAPTHAASRQCCLGTPSLARLSVVLPPLDSSSGRTLDLRTSTSAQRVALVAQELFNGTYAFRLVAPSAGDAQVTHTVTAPSSARADVFDVERDVSCPAVGTAALPLLQQVFTHFVTGQRPLLVLHAADAGLLHRLCVEAHMLDGESRHGRQPPIASDPRSGAIHPRLERRRQPSLRT